MDSFLKITFWTALVLMVYAYCLYPVLLWLLERLFKAPKFLSNNDCPAVSLIVTAYNEEKVIESRIRNCLALDYPKDKLEIIIASDGSTDKTTEIVQKYASEGVVLHAYSERRGKVNALNETVPRAKHSIVLFSDANTMFTRQAVKKLVPHFADPNVGCVCGGLQFISAQGSTTGELEGIYWRYEIFLKKMEGKRGALLGANGAIFAIRKGLYQPLESDTIIEDFVLPMRILQKGFACLYAPEASAIEEAAHKIVQEKQRRIRIGAGDFQALFRLLPMLNPLRGFPALAFFSHKVLRWLAPFFLIIAFVTNIFLLTSGGVYVFIFILQCVFYLAALAGQLMAHRKKSFKLLSLCYYFVSMNLALFLGFLKFLQGTQSVKWDRTER